MVIFGKHFDFGEQVLAKRIKTILKDLASNSSRKNWQTDFLGNLFFDFCQLVDGGTLDGLLFHPFLISHFEIFE